MLTIIKRQPIGVLKVMAILSALAMLLAFAGCDTEGIGESGSGADTNTTASTTVSTENSEPTDSENTQNGKPDAVTESTGSSKAKESTKAPTTTTTTASGGTSADIDFINFDDDGGEKKEYCTMTIEDDFDDHTILLVLTKKKSWEKTIFMPTDFPEVECAEVKSINSESRELIYKQQKALKTINIVYTDYDTTFRKLQDRLNSGGFVPKELLDADNVGIHLLDPDTYREMLSLKLKKSGKQNVLDAVHILEKRADILSADVNGYGTVL